MEDASKETNHLWCIIWAINASWSVISCGESEAMADLETLGTSPISYMVQQGSRSVASCILGYRTCSRRWSLAIYFPGFQSPKPLISFHSISGARQTTSGCVASPPLHSTQLLATASCFHIRRGGEQWRS